MINDTLPDADLRHYLYQIIHRCVEYGGNYRGINRGISRGCPLSPILGALYLKALDDHFADKQLYYGRYMDDISNLTKTRWQNRKAVKELNQILNQLKVEKHPDKTYIGKVENGFIPGILPSTFGPAKAVQNGSQQFCDFLGCHFNGNQLTVAEKTVEKHVLQRHQLYTPKKGQALSNRKKATSEFFFKSPCPMLFYAIFSALTNDQYGEVLMTRYAITSPIRIFGSVFVNFGMSASTGPATSSAACSLSMSSKVIVAST